MPVSRLAFDPPEALICGVRRGVQRTTSSASVTSQESPINDAALPSWSMGKSIVGTLMGQLDSERACTTQWAPAPVDEWQRPDDPRRAIRHAADLLRMSSPGSRVS